MAGAALNATLFLISIVFDFYLTVLFIRLMLAFEHANYYHPLTQFVTRLTDFMIKPMKKILVSIRGFESATLVLMLLVAALKNLLLIALSFGFPDLIGILILSVSDTLRIMLQTLSFILLLQAIISWLQPGSPNYFTLANLTASFLYPIRKILPPIGGIDLSLFVALIILQVLSLVLVNPLTGYGRAISLGMMG